MARLSVEDSTRDRGTETAAVGRSTRSVEAGCNGGMSAPPTLSLPPALPSSFAGFALSLRAPLALRLTPDRDCFRP